MRQFILGFILLFGSAASADYTNMTTVVSCSNPAGFLNPVRIHVMVKKSYDGRFFAHVERRKWWGSELRAHAEVKRQAADQGRVPVAYVGDGVQLVVTDKRVNVRNPNYFNNTFGDFAAQVLYYDMKLEMNMGQGILCAFEASY